MIAIYRAALHLLPRAVRERHGDQMAAVLADLLREARRRQGTRGVLRLLLSELVGLLWFACCEHRGRPSPPRIDERLFTWPLEPEGRPEMLASLAQDIRYAARMLRRAPGFTLVAVVTMALAIGANTAIFSVVNSVLLRSLPFADPDEIVVLGHHTNGADALDSTTPGNLYDWMKSATAFQSIAGFSPTERIITSDGNAERIRGGLSIGSIFEVLGRQAAEGRTLSAADDEPGADPAVVLSARLARRLFAGRSAIGQSLGINSVPHTVVGVMPADFAFFDYDYQYWVPARFDAAFRNNRDQYFLAGVARLKPGVSVQQAEAQLDTVMDGIRREYPQFTQNATAAVAPMKEVLLDGIEARLFTLMGAVLFVLLIACANLANLLLARASTRRREVAVRHALGARPGRLVRQMLTESLLLALIGGAAGFALGAALLRVLVAMLPDTLPRIAGVALDGNVMLFTAGMSLASGVLFGLFPAMQLASRAPMEAVREGTRGSARSRWVRTTLVVSELALALMLLVGAGLLTRSFAHLLEVPPGFQTDRLLTFTASVPTAIYKTPVQRAAFFERAAAQIETLPGVRSVTMTTTLPVAGRGNGAWFNMLDRPWPATETPPGIPNRVVRSNYFQSLGIPLVRGRYFTRDDRLERTHAVIISESVARRFWPNEEALGRRIYMGTADNKVVPDSEIVGIVADVKQTGLDEERPEAVYAPLDLVPAISGMTFAIRTSTDPASLVPDVRRVIRQLDPGVPLVRVQTMDAILARATAPARSSMVLVGLFAGVALTLAIIGVFGVLSYTVEQRTTELGIRMALGATARNVKLLVLGQSLLPVAAGMLIGLAGALALTRFMATLLFGVTPTDPVTFAAVSMLLGGIAAAASYIPARRATRVDPVVVLRRE
jgi:putative ABC transport system permease protein